MAVHNIFIFVVFFLSFECLLSATWQCHPFNIEQCWAQNQNTNGCYFYDKVLTCLNETLGECNDRDTLTKNQQIELVVEEKKQCPNITEGDCFRNRLGGCLQELHPHLYGDLNDEKCKHASGPARDETVKCLNAIKTVCPSNSTRSEIKKHFYHVLQRDADCWFREKYEKNHQ